MKARCRPELRGGHMHVDVFVYALATEHWQLAGRLVFTEAEWRALAASPDGMVHLDCEVDEEERASSPPASGPVAARGSR